MARYDDCALAVCRFIYILIATHGAALQSMMLWVNKQPICDFWKSGLKKNCSVTKVEVKDGQIKVLEEGEKQYTA